MSALRDGEQPGDWRAVGDGVYVCVAEPCAVNVGLVVGSRAALLVDTGSTPEQGRALRTAVSQVTDQPLTTVVLTHWHYDHAFGLAAFPDLDTIAHESVPARLQSPEAAVEAARLGFSAAELALPRRELVVAAAVDLGDRRVEVAHLGQGHTDGDLVVVVPDADLVFVGDLLESAGPPSFGDDCYPEEWGVTLDGVIGLMTAGTRAVPGHGDPVDRLFAFGQRGEVAGVAGEIRRLVESGVPEAEAVARGNWPYPEPVVARGVARGYRALAASGVKGTRPTLPLA
jgi:glyoxylase-like metal-dependent hydrolase (beta-lactamase superfamily II)